MSSKKSMKIFTGDKEEEKLDWTEQILRNIALGGTATRSVNPIIGGNIRHVLSLSSGAPRLQTNVVKKFALILSQPSSISILNPFEIRCCLCNSVIHYPAWYYCIKYAVNHFHYFICWDDKHPNEPSTACYRRS